MEDATTAPTNQVNPPEPTPIQALPPSPPEPTKSEPVPVTAQEHLRNIQDSVLNFLATASNETLGACAIGLCASTYLVLGRVGLILIGAVGGVVLHATWEGQAGGDGKNAAQESSRRRKELGVEVVRRALDWRDSTQNQQGKTEEGTHDVVAAAEVVDFSDFQPATRDALNALKDAVIRDYVKWWYTPLLPKEQSFPRACQQTLVSFIRSFANHLSRKRSADPFLDFLANSTSIVIVFLQELATALKASQRQDAAEAIRTYLDYQPESSLANVLSAEQQERKLSLVADDILQNFLDPKAYNFPPAKAFLREVLAGLVLEMTVQTCSKPEWINEWIVYLLEDGEPELMNVIDAGVEDMSGKLGSLGARDGASPKKDVKRQRRVSRAEEAMEEAMREAQRLNAMIAEDDARRKRGLASAEVEDASSIATTEPGIVTPNSSDSDRNRQADRSMESSMVFDIEGNIMPSATPSPMKELPSFMHSEQIEARVPVAQHMPQPTYTPPAPAEVMMAVPLTLHNSTITILDLGDGNERAALKQKPMSDYLLTIEPASSRFPGWVVTRKYVDFEVLHETIRRIASISGANEFTQKHSMLPNWRMQTRGSLIGNLEVYLRHALKFEPLAESEAMKKFLEKETGLEKVPAANKNVLVQGSAALENVGKNFINVLGQGGKGIAGGGKAVLGGVQGVFGAVATGVGGQKKVVPAARASRPTHPTTNSSFSTNQRSSQDLLRQSTDMDSSGRPPLPARLVRMSSDYAESTRSSSRDSLESRRAELLEESLNLPPPPSSIPDGYVPLPAEKRQTPPRPMPLRMETSRPGTPTSAQSKGPDEESPLAQRTPPPAPTTKRPRKNDTPITEEETRVSIELIFAIITELYSLSSAWTIRLSLLAAAKTFLLRPNNPQMESIRLLLQDSVIDANFSDSGLASHINKLRENTLPTEEERAKWPKEMTAEEKEKLRMKARKLLVERGMPQALTSVMGAAASGEALGRVFDCLQVEEVARGLIFALLLQAIRAATQ